ncbi:MAG: nitroreductase family protein [Bacteroidia bacterium]|nr:nitroreductase family protein [Bacteroidia bacterium]
MDFSEVIEKRHSVRSFTAASVEREVLERIIAAADTAPSSKNCRSSAFLVIEDRDTLRAISEMRTAGSAFVKDAPAAIVVLGDSSETDMWVENSSISATFIQLAATDCGLGSCWVQVRGRLRDKSDPAKGTAEDYLRNLLGIKERFSVLCVVALGYEAE